MSLYLAVFGKPRYLGLVDIGDSGLGAGRWIVIKTLRGLEMGLLGGTLSKEQEAKYCSVCLNDVNDEHTKGPEPMLQEVEFVEAASDAHIQDQSQRRTDEEAVLVRSRQILSVHPFQMKLVDVEYTMDRKKLFFYFTSEQRVDFRAYVRDLAKEFRIRIEMRQIGVRDEAKTVRGISPCGRPCCCSYWLHRFTPINIRMVKEQNLALNPTKISGICGRLMCCMFYEHFTYSEIWKNLPSPGSKIRTPQGSYVLEGVDLYTETVRVSFPEGGEAPIPIARFNEFKETILRGETWQKEEEKEEEKEEKKVLPYRSPLRRNVLSRIHVPGIRPSPLPAKSVEIQDNAVKNTKKAETVKVSANERPVKTAVENAQTEPGHSKEDGQRKRQRRHKGAPPDVHGGERSHVRPAPEQRPDVRGGAGDKDSKIPHHHKERDRPQEHRPKNDGVVKNERGEPGAHGKKRPRSRGGRGGAGLPDGKKDS